jgi:prepilin signal peptidase PulO-like enzyme (type II secretory pathway)
MYLIKKIGDFFFKRESMGGGDIKLMFTFGLVLGVLNSILSIFLASIIGLPISLLLLHYKKNHEVPFGPYLSIAAIIILLTNFNIIDMYLI